MAKRPTRSSQVLFLALAIFVAGAHCNVAQPSARDVSKESARATRDWVRDGVVYEIYRAFSQQGDFNGITARLDNLEGAGCDHSMADAHSSDWARKEERNYR